jgi:hypothetical protein
MSLSSGCLRLGALKRRRSSKADTGAASTGAASASSKLENEALAMTRG